MGQPTHTAGGIVARMSPADRRRELVTSALRVIAEHGVAGATTRAIVAEAGMSLASFHYAFESRDTMMRELIEFVVKNETTAAFATIELGADVRDTLRAGLQGYFDNLVADPGHEQVMFELLHYALRTPDLHDLAREQYERYYAGVTELIEATEQAGIRWTKPHSDIARAIVSFTDGITLSWLADRDSEASARLMDFAADSLAQLAHPLPSAHSKEHTP